MPERLQSSLWFAEDELAHEILQCNGCGVCRTHSEALRMCPVFRALGDELATPRAKVTILDYLATGQADEKVFESSEFRRLLDLCVNCKACRLQCPSGVDVSKLMTAARTVHVRRNRLRRTEWALSNNRWLSRMGAALSPVSNLIAHRSAFAWLIEKMMGLDRHRAIPGFDRGAFLPAGRAYLEDSEPVVDPIDRVCYFTDTYVNYHDHELGFDVLDVLRSNGVEVVLPDQRPVPLPAICYGGVKRARRDLAAVIDGLLPWIQEGYKVVCSEPSAALVLQQELRHFAEGAAVSAVSENTYELMNYLRHLHQQGRLRPCPDPIPQTYAYHAPCHLGGAAGAASAALLPSLCQAQVHELNAGCCGLSGTFGLQKKNYDLSLAMGEGLKEALIRAETNEVLTECAACKMQIEHLCPDCRVFHPVSVLARAYGF